MHRLRSLGRGGRLLVALAVGGALFGIATAVQADIPDSGTINACYYSPGKLAPANPRKGALRVIDKSKGQTCASDETSLSWNAKGVSGATGPTGPTGPSDLWVGPSSEHVLTAYPDAGDLAKVSSVAVPAGKYFLSGDVEGYNSSATATPQCQLLSDDAGTTVANEGTFDHAIAAGDADSWTVQATATVTTGPSTIYLQCQNLATTTGVGVEGNMFAQLVGAIH